MSSTPHRRTRGEQGIAIIMTSLCLLPLMVFAAFGVDLASWYSRISYLQKAADAAALAGTVWMPEINEATDVACESLAKNGVSGAPDCGTDGPFEVHVSEGSTASSLRVSVTDPNATRYFSQVFRGDQSLSRTAEAEYNLPLPLGSPLNYFGGDADRTIPATPDPVWSVAWPTDYTTRAPSNAPCNIDANPAHALGRWNTGPTVFQAGLQHTSGTGNRLCQWPPAATQPVGATYAGNAAAQTLVPNNVPCNRLQISSPLQNGRWNTGSPPTYTNNRFSTGTGNQQCTWTIVSQAANTLPAGATAGFPPPSGARGCNVPNVPPTGRWPSGTGGFEANQFFNSGTQNRLCQWTALTTSTTPPTPPNPIAANRSPGFWGVIRGPGDVSDLGDAFSVRCRGTQNCGSTNNNAYRDTGYWYVIKMPHVGAANTTIRIFDAAYNAPPSGTGPTADQGGDFSGGDGFTTTYTLYKQNNALDFNDKTVVSSCPSLSVQNQSTYAVTWTDLCTISPSNDDIYLLNVTSSAFGTNSQGANGYALEAIAAGLPDGPQQPSVYAFADMAMRTEKTGNSNASFYLAEVGPQHAGKTLVIELYDAGDFTGPSTVRPLMPKTGSAPNLNWTDVPSGSCRYTSSPAPNGQFPGGSNDRWRTSTAVTTPTMPGAANCAITTQSGTGNSTRQFNDTWLTIRVTIPADYTCTPGLNPEMVPGTCWWGVRYDYQNGAGETTTWRAGVEGNPVHLTQ